MPIKSILVESKKGIITLKSKKQSNWSLWNKIGKLSYLELTGRISAKLYLNTVTENTLL